MCRPSASARVYVKRLTDFYEIRYQSYSQKFVDQAWVSWKVVDSRLSTEGGNRISIRMGPLECAWHFV